MLATHIWKPPCKIAQEFDCSGTLALFGTTISAPQDPSPIFENIFTLQMLDKLLHVVVNCGSILLQIIRQKRMEVKDSVGLIIGTWKMDGASFN